MALFGGLGLVLGAIGTIGGLVTGFQQIEAQKDAEKKQQELLDAQRKRRTRNVLASKTRAQAEVEAAGVSGGVEGSVVQGALSSLNAQATGQIGFNAQIEAGSDAIRGISEDIRDLGMVGSVFEGIGSLGVTLQREGEKAKKEGPTAEQAFAEYSGQQGAPTQSSLAPGLQNPAKSGKVASQGFLNTRSPTARRDPNDPFGLRGPEFGNDPFGLVS